MNGHVVTAAHWVGGFNINLQIVYGFFNPLGPIIDNARRTMLLGLSPEWTLVGVAALGLGPLPPHRLPDLQAVGGELCRHCLTGSVEVEHVWKKFRADRTVPKFYDQMKRFGNSIESARPARLPLGAEGRQPRCPAGRDHGA